jgi:hypothetical protein
VQDADECFFVMKGTVDVGFEVSRYTKYVIRLSKRIAIGAYECAFDEKSLFVYKVSSKKM